MRPNRRGRGLEAWRGPKGEETKRDNKNGTKNESQKDKKNTNGTKKQALETRQKDASGTIKTNHHTTPPRPPGPPVDHPPLCVCVWLRVVFVSGVPGTAFSPGPPFHFSRGIVAPWGHRVKWCPNSREDPHKKKLIEMWGWEREQRETLRPLTLWPLFLGLGAHCRGVVVVWKCFFPVCKFLFCPNDFCFVPVLFFCPVAFFLSGAQSFPSFLPSSGFDPWPEFHDKTIQMGKHENGKNSPKIWAPLPPFAPTPSWLPSCSLLGPLPHISQKPFFPFGSLCGSTRLGPTLSVQLPFPPLLSSSHTASKKQQ